MPFLNKLNEFAKNVSDKASSALETNKLNSKINSEQNSINEQIKKIGEHYYQQYTETGSADEGIAEFCAAIDKHNAAIAEAKAEIEQIKAENAAAATDATVSPPVPVPAENDFIVCPACGKANGADMKFCSECGGKLETDKIICTCGAQLAPGTKFCSACGSKLEAEKRTCTCGAEILPGVRFCGECGAKFEE